MPKSAQLIENGVALKHELHHIFVLFKKSGQGTNVAALN